MTEPEPSSPQASSGPDSAVMASFVLGWRLAELYDRDSLPPPSEKPEEEQVPEHLPGASEMTDHDRAIALLRQAEAALAVLGATVSELPALKIVQEVLDRPGHHRDDVRRQILCTHLSIHSVLLGANPRMATSYGLGRLLADTALLPHSRKPEIFAERFDHYRLDNARHWLDDLTSSFNPCATAAVTASLDAWEAWIDSQQSKDGAIDPAVLDEHVVRSLRSQGELWRRLLSGEKDPIQLLGPKDYVEAGERLLQRVLEITTRYLHRWWAVIAAFGVVTATAIWAAATYAPTGGDRVIAVVVSVATALGLSWKGVGSTLGKALSQAETALWTSEVNVAVNKAATELPTVSQPKRD